MTTTQNAVAAQVARRALPTATADPAQNAISGLLADQMNYAKALASSNMLPAQYRGKPENLLYAIGYAEMLGVHPFTAVTGIHVIEGKPSASVALISSLVRRAGHRLRVTGDTKSATAQIVRKDDPDFTFTVTFTMDDAKAANLAGKGVWKSYPASMLKARAITQCARDACEDALSGLHYTAEELGAEVTEEGVPVSAGVIDMPPVRPAERHSSMDPADPWTLPPLRPGAVTDEGWLQGWTESLASAEGEDDLRRLWASMVEMHQTLRLTDRDRNDLTDVWRDARRELTAPPTSAVEHERDSANAQQENEASWPDAAPVPA